MPDEKYTRCPGCRTIFRVTDEQLAIRGGQVRCGHCKYVFDGNAERVALGPRAPTDAPYHDEARFGPLTVTLRPAQALQSVAEPASTAAGALDAAAAAPPIRAPGAADATPDAAAEARAERGAEDAAAAGAQPPPTPTMDRESEAAPVDGAREPAAAVDYDDRFSRLRRGRFAAFRNKLSVLALPLLLLALITQAAFHFRDTLAAQVPSVKPLLVQACAVLGCAIRPLQDSGALSIEASDLQADPAHRGLLMLTATLRNRAGWSLAYPHLELTLTDAQDEVVVRRALVPGEYVGAGADPAAGIPANADVPIKLFIDASATTQAGYRIYAFYP